jgi:hypothetical protein
MDHNGFHITVSKTKVVLTIRLIQLIQVQTKCWIDHGVGNEEIPSQKQNLHGIWNPKYLTIPIDMMLEAVILKMLAASSVGWKHQSSKVGVVKGIQIPQKC